MLRVLLVTDTAKAIGELRATLLQQDYDVLPDAVSSTALLWAVEQQRPDVVIIDTESPSRDTLEQLAVMNATAPRPVVMFTPDANQQLIRAAVGAGVTTYVVDGLAAEKLSPIIEVALVRFAEDDRLRQRLAKVEQQLSDRKLIDRAKGVLMDKRGLTEAAAYELLRTQAMKQGQKLADVARQLINMSDLLG
ncbi:ANTAR domain-containing response regulator [Amantichitinum ursilacus]|uniref:Putative transcriptional regulatory protein pdtaR n=1 Tax=Amantichitinum ursilacus TaxID=857265 RepID=A0A0N1JS06_9NEIS|nr:ANTAR domain-containing protein [Amantichitinum ursilacus]KPC50495.1 putative transcriptional regulatory protein pdtaR [Amantichitinum ursilacus]